MKTLGKILAVIALAMVALGLVFAAIGYFTGGSPGRIVELAFGSAENLRMMVKMLFDQVKSLL